MAGPMIDRLRRVATVPLMLLNCATCGALLFDWLVLGWPRPLERFLMYGLLLNGGYFVIERLDVRGKLKRAKQDEQIRSIAENVELEQEGRRDREWRRRRMLRRKGVL